MHDGLNLHAGLNGTGLDLDVPCHGRLHVRVNVHAHCLERAAIFCCAVDMSRQRPTRVNRAPPGDVAR